MLKPNPKRLFSSDDATRKIANDLYEKVAKKAILSPHGHVEAKTLLENKNYANPSELLITPDHYVTRLMHAHGIDLKDLGLRRIDINENEEIEAQKIWQIFCKSWHIYAGTPVRYWFETELNQVFGINEIPSESNSLAIYEQIDNCLRTDAYKPRALFEKFNIEVLATTDDPADDLAAHHALKNDPTFTGRVVPTFRADKYMNPFDASWKNQLEKLSIQSGINCLSYRGLISALENRRAYFKSLGATATDTGVIDAWAIPISDSEAENIHAKALKGNISEAEGIIYRQNMLYNFARMSCEDGLVMQLHPGVIRNLDKETFQKFGPDTGHDFPSSTKFIEPLKHILNDFGKNPNFHLVLFTVDETTFAREIAPLAGFYPSVYAGAPWWFLDTPAAITRFRMSITDSAGFYKTSGFIDDTRAFCSIPARHDMSRRLDANFLASLVTTHQLSEEEAYQVADDFVDAIPRKVFKL